MTKANCFVFISASALALVAAAAIVFVFAASIYQVMIYQVTSQCTYVCTLMTNVLVSALVKFNYKQQHGNNRKTADTERPVQAYRYNNLL